MSDDTQPLLSLEHINDKPYVKKKRSRRKLTNAKKKVGSGEVEVQARRVLVGLAPEKKLGKEVKGRLAILRKFTESCRVSADGTSTSSSGTRADQEEEISNFGCSAESPNADTPPEETERVEEIATELKARTTDKTDLGLGKEVALLLTNCFNFPYLLLLPWHYARHGVSYLIVLFTLTALFAFPTALMELACGQYTNADPTKFYHRISPASRGFGWLVIFYRFYSITTAHNDMRHLLYLKTHLVGLFNADDDVVGNVYGSPTTGMGQERLNYDCIGDNKAIFLNGTCMKPPDPIEMPFIQALAVVMKAEPSRTLTPSQVMVAKESETTWTRQALAILVAAVVAAGVCVRGIGCLAKLSFLLASAPFIAIFSIVFLIRSSFVTDLQVNWGGLIVVRPESWTNPFLYTDALSSMFALYSLGDGSWHFVGALMNYRKNLVIPVVVSLLLQSLLVLLFTFVLLFLNTSFVLHRLTQFGRDLNGQVDLGVDEYSQESQLFNYDSIDILLPEMVDSGIGPYIVFKLAIYIATIGFHTTTFEAVVQAILWGSPRLSTLKNARLYIVFGLLTLSGLHSIFISHDKHHITFRPLVRDSLGLTRSVLLLAQFAYVVFAYGHDRLLSMVTRNGNALSALLVSFLRFAWRRLALPLILCHFFIHLLGMEFTTLTGPIFANLISIFAPVVCFIFQWTVDTKSSEDFSNLFRPHAKWGPSSFIERRRAASDERAAKVV